MPEAVRRLAPRCADSTGQRGCTRFDWRARLDFELPLTPRSELVERGLVGVQLDLFVDHLAVLERSRLPSVLGERFALDPAKLGRLFDPLLDLCFGRRVKHDGRLAPLRCRSTRLARLATFPAPRGTRREPGLQRDAVRDRDRPKDRPMLSVGVARLLGQACERPSSLSTSSSRTAGFQYRRSRSSSSSCSIRRWLRCMVRR